MLDVSDDPLRMFPDEASEMGRRMENLTRKQREIKEREDRILTLARQMLAEGGYLGLSMDAIAEQLEYSKGTIYNHFPCKEEIIISLAVETMDRRLGMFQRAAEFVGHSRERISAIGVAAELFVRLYPQHFFVEQIIRSASIWEKTTEKRRSLMQSCEHRCMGIVSGIIRDGIAQGDLKLPEGIVPEDLAFGLWSQCFGAYSIIATSDSLPQLGISDPFVAVRRNISTMLDGYGWQKLSSDYDYQQLFERISAEVFADEYQTLQSV